MVIESAYVSPLARVILTHNNGVVIDGSGGSFVGIADSRIQQVRETSETSEDILLDSGVALSFEAHCGGYTLEVANEARIGNDEHESF